jgi:hypothetical protein
MQTANPSAVAASPRSARRAPRAEVMAATHQLHDRLAHSIEGSTMLRSLWRRLFSHQRSAVSPLSHSGRAVLRLEHLEDRLTPADLTPSISGTTLTLTEAAGISDSITITASGTHQEFNVTTSFGTLYTTPTPVTAIVLRLSSGSDNVQFDGTVLGRAITLPGGLTMSSAGGNKTISANQVNLPGSAALNITLGGNGTENTTFTDSNVGGAARIMHTGSGTTSFTITTSANNQTATNHWGSLTISNGAGSDTNTIQDTDFSGNVTIANGAGDNTTTQFGGSHTVFSALNSKGLLSVTGGINVSTATGQSDTEVYDYNVHGGVTLDAGNGIASQSSANFIGLENNQTVAGSGLPVIGGSTTLAGAAVGTAGLTIDVGGSTGKDFPIVLHGNLGIATRGNGAATITLNDVNAASGSATTIGLGPTTKGDTVNINGDQATATFGALTITSAAAGNNTINLQTQQGTLNMAGSANVNFFGGGSNTVNAGSNANGGVVQTTGSFGVNGNAASSPNITTNAQNDVFGGLNFRMTNGNATTTFTDVNVTGAATINHTGTGNTTLTVNVSSSNANLLNHWNSLSVTNGTGQDINSITDTNFASNVSISNGNGAPTFTGRFGGSQTVFSAARNQGLLTVSGNLSISTGTGQSSTEVYDYNVHGGLNINSGAGIVNQGAPNFIGIEDNQTTKNSGLPVIGGNSTISGGGPARSGVTIQVGTNGTNDYPIAVHGNLAVNATGNGAATITLNDINATSGTTDSINLGSGTDGNTVNIRGDNTTATLGSLNVTSAATGTNTFNLQTQQGTLNFAGGGGSSGSAMFNFSSGTDLVNVGSIANKGVVQTAGNFGVGGTGGNITTTATNSTFGGVAFNLAGSSVPTTTFTDINVTGPATIKQTGNTSLTINTSSSNANALNSWTSLAITDGTGSDLTSVTDTDFSGDVNIATGAGAIGDTRQFGGSHTVLSAANNKGLLTVGGNLSISTTNGQSDSEVYDYNVHGNVNISTGTGVRGQTNANLVGIEDKQTTKGSGVPVIDGSVTINGTTVPGSTPELVIDLGTDGQNGNFPLTIGGNLSVNAGGVGSATIDLNDLSVSNGTTTLMLAASTSNNLVQLQGSTVPSVYNNLTMNSLAAGNNTFKLQDSAGTMHITGTANLHLGPGNDILDLAADAAGPAAGATLEFFGMRASTFDGGAGANQLFAAEGNTVFFQTRPTVRNFSGPVL